MDREKGGFGFIEQDSGEDSMFVMPIQCQAFGGMLPSLGTRVTYFVVEDAKTGRPRAEDVQPEVAREVQRANGFIRPIQRPVVVPIQRPLVVNGGRLQSFVGGGVNLMNLISHPSHAVGPKRPNHEQERQSGTMSRDKGNFGFIEVDGGGEMFVMPAQCNGFAGALPALSERVTFSVVTDPKTGRPRAEDVQPLQPAKKPRLNTQGAKVMTPDGMFKSWVNGATMPASAGVDEGAEHLGTFDRVKGKFGFIKHDSGGADMFVMPLQCGAFGGVLPPVGTRVVYEIVTDAKTGLPRAENVRPADDSYLQ
jgi:cold shock CspA family protein